MPKNNTQIIKDLSELLGEFQDLESQSYILQKNMLLKDGITIGIRDIKIVENSCYLNNVFLKINVTFSELIQTKVNLIRHLSLNRKQTYVPCLFMEDTYELSFISNGITSDYKVAGTLSELTTRIHPATRTKKKENFLQSLPKDFLELINQSGRLDINVKLTAISDNRLRCEANTKILNTSAYIQELLSPQNIYSRLRFATSLDKPKNNRLSLWGLEPIVSKDNKQKRKTLESIIDKIPPLYDHGIKNCIHLKFLVENLDSKVLTNEELLNPSLEVLDLTAKHLNFQQILINNLPYA